MTDHPLGSIVLDDCANLLNSSPTLQKMMHQRRHAGMTLFAEEQPYLFHNMTNADLMHQPLPLPGHIPMPDKQQLQDLARLGISVNCGDSARKYVECTLPKDWQIVDRSATSQFPKWYIVNTDGAAQVAITGSWNPPHCVLKLDTSITPFTLDPETTSLSETKKDGDAQDEQIETSECPTKDSLMTMLKELLGAAVIYADTDSIFVNVPRRPHNESCLEEVD